VLFLYLDLNFLSKVFEVKVKIRAQLTSKILKGNSEKKFDSKEKA